MDKLMKHPKTIKDMAYEIRKAVDMYWARQISEIELKEILFFWATNEGKKLFKANDLNPTVKFLIGERREDLINKLLEGFQHNISNFDNKKR
jgi:uncharacterized protein (TIGR04540 family)